MLGGDFKLCQIVEISCMNLNMWTGRIVSPARGFDGHNVWISRSRYYPNNLVL